MLYSALFVILAGLGMVAAQQPTGFMCALNCTFRHANAWATVLSLNNPSTQLINWVQGIPQSQPAKLDIPLNSTNNNDSLSKVCEVYDSYSGCLNKCPDDMFRQGVLNSMSGIQMICTTQRKEFTSNTMPCVQQFATSIQEMCRAENEAFMASTNQLQNYEKEHGASFIGVLQRLCESALSQSQCVVPAVQQKCGDSASGLLHELMSASLGSVEKLIGDRRDMMPVQCKELFNVIVKNENGSIAIVLPPGKKEENMLSDQPMNDMPMGSNGMVNNDTSSSKDGMRLNEEMFSASYRVFSVYPILSFFTFYCVVFLLQNFP